MLWLNKYLNYLYFNLGGFYSTTQRNNRFYLHIQDGATRQYYAEPKRTKSQTFDTFQMFMCIAERQFGKKLKPLYIDFGGEFANKTFK